MGEEELTNRIMTMQRELLAMQTELRLRRISSEVDEDPADQTPVDEPPIGAAKQYPTPFGETVGVWGDRYPGFLGKAAGDGVLRADTTGLDYLYVAGNDFVTIGHKDTSTLTISGSRAVTAVDGFGHVTAVSTNPAVTVPDGTQIGQMMYWDGTKWAATADTPSSPSVLCFNSGNVPVWVQVSISTQTVYSDGTDMIADDLRAGA